jgi:hypothetical protein
VHHFVTNHAWLLTTKQLRAAVKRLNFDEPHCLVKNLTGKFMLTPKELMEDLQMTLPKAQYLLKNASTTNKCKGDIHRAKELQKSMSGNLSHVKYKLAKLNIQTDALIARPNDTFVQVKKRTHQLHLLLNDKKSL